jgi:hypothetical protein
MTLRLLRGKTAFGEIIRRSGPTEIEFGRILFRLAQEEVARGEKSVEFGQVIDWTVSGWSLKIYRPGV